MEPVVKSPLLSKTLWINFVLAAAALFYPPAQDWIAANPSLVAMVFSAINIGIRFITKDKLGFE